jgi:hypothetical protein
MVILGFVRGRGSVSASTLEMFNGLAIFGLALSDISGLSSKVRRVIGERNVGVTEDDRQGLFQYYDESVW